MFGVAVFVGSIYSGVAVGVSGAMVSTGNVLLGVGPVGVTVGVSVGSGVLVGVSVAIIAVSVSAAMISADLVSVAVGVEVALGVIYFCTSVAMTASVTRDIAAFSAIAVSCCGVLAERVQASDGIKNSRSNVPIVNRNGDFVFIEAGLFR